MLFPLESLFGKVKIFRFGPKTMDYTVNVRITAPLEFKRHFDTELVFSLYLKRLLYLLGLGAT